MKIKAIAIQSIFYTVCMFLIGQFVLNPDKTVMHNIVFAVLSGVLFTVFMVLFYRFNKPGKSGKKEAV